MLFLFPPNLCLDDDDYSTAEKHSISSVFKSAKLLVEVLRAAVCGDTDLWCANFMWSAC